MQDKKTKIMNFADGPKPIQLGQVVVYDNAQLGNYHKVTESTVEYIGRSLVTLANGDKFYLESGVKKSKNASGRLYSSKELYYDYKAGRIWKNF